MKKEMTVPWIWEELAEQSERDQNTLYKIPEELVRNKYMMGGGGGNKWQWEMTAQYLFLEGAICPCIFYTGNCKFIIIQFKLGVLLYNPLV